jgi:hypothetical protein
MKNMEEQLIEFETAKLAKEKGFDEECRHTLCNKRTRRKNNPRIKYR